MKKFSIDLTGDNKRYRKLAVKYLREQGYTVCKRKDNPEPMTNGNFNYLSNYHSVNHCTSNFHYYSSCSDKEEVLTLPRDWPKLIEYTQKEPKYVNFEFKKGVWYKYDIGEPKYKCLVNYQGETNNYGFWFNSKWFDKHIRLKPSHHWTEATPEEIKEHLIEEAKKRGFKEWISVKWDNCSANPILGNGRELGEHFYYIPDRDQLELNGWAIYQKGQWAEIIEEPFKINGHEVKIYDNNTFYVGCVNFSRERLNKLMEAMKLVSTHPSIELNIKVKGEDVSYEDLIKLKEYLDNK